MRFWLIALLLWPLAVMALEPEEFKPPEEGVVFDIPRTGLLFERRVYDEDKRDITFDPYNMGYNDTRYIGAWKFYIEKWYQDPPSQVVVYVRDDSPYFYEEAKVDIRVRIGQYDRANNLVVANERIVRDIPIHKGLTMVPIAIHNYRGDIVRINLIGVHTKLPYHPIEFGED
ncbi:MAG: hypothetical protein D6819_08520 [Gammaproteobacteria bacterium]|nr:MAG: hypothetical protein D6819_08520 [Gammaproteobacteria bacterium]